MIHILTKNTKLDKKLRMESINLNIVLKTNYKTPVEKTL
tara:strand:- start:384 stop:500 length:117 start_codon:yes stop_codon:yes gene_type:complete